MTLLDYLAHRRRIILLDEWGYYTALAGLYWTNEMFLFTLVLFYGALCMWISYQSFWALEKAVLGNLSGLTLDITAGQNDDSDAS